MREWANLTATPISPFDVEVLRGLEGLELTAYANRPKPQGD
jgi:hypothetical protein